MLDYQIIRDLIQGEKSKEACTIALDLLSQPQQELDEAIRYRLMRDVYFRLKDKERVIECGRLSAKYANQYFRDRKILDDEILNNLCLIIKEWLVHNGKYNINISAGISDKGVNLCIYLKNSKGDVVEEIQTLELKKEMEQKIEHRVWEERKLYYYAACQEICSAIKDNVPDSLYKELYMHVGGSA